METIEFIVVIVWYSSFLFLLLTGRLGYNIKRWLQGGIEHKSIVIVCFSVVDSFLLVVMYPFYILMQLILSNGEKFTRVVSVSLREVLGLSLLVRVEFFLKGVFHGD